jgi:hypothetical protein
MNGKNNKTQTEKIMQTFDIYHAGEGISHDVMMASFNDEKLITLAEEKIKNYYIAAVVTCESLADVFFFTNSIDFYWGEHDNVEVVPHQSRPGHRSTSVGDIVRDNITGKSFVCASCGWKELK